MKGVTAGNVLERYFGIETHASPAAIPFDELGIHGSSAMPFKPNIIRPFTEEPPGIAFDSPRFEMDPELSDAKQSLRDWFQKKMPPENASDFPYTISKPKPQEKREYCIPAFRPATFDYQEARLFIAWIEGKMDVRPVDQGPIPEIVDVMGVRECFRQLPTYMQASILSDASPPSSSWIARAIGWESKKVSVYEAVDSGLRSRAVLTESDLKDMVGKAFKSVWKTYADWASEFEDPRSTDFIIDLALVHEKVTELYKRPASRPGYIE